MRPPRPIAHPAARRRANAVGGLHRGTRHCIVSLGGPIAMGCSERQSPRDLPIRQAHVDSRVPLRTEVMAAKTDSAGTAIAPFFAIRALVEGRGAARGPSEDSLAASRTAAAILAIDGLRAEVAPRQHWFAGVLRIHMREIALVVRHAKYLQPGLTNGARPIAEVAASRSARMVPASHRDRRRGMPLEVDLHIAAPARASGGISCAVGCACLSACNEIFTAKTHIATTSATKTAQTTASR